MRPPLCSSMTQFGTGAYSRRSLRPIFMPMSPSSETPVKSNSAGHINGGSTDFAAAADLPDNSATSARLLGGCGIVMTMVPAMVGFDVVSV